MMTEEEAEMLTRNICARIWRTYGEVYHGQEWIGLDNIPEDGALIVYYHGPVPVDYFGLVAEMWLRRNKTVHSVVDRSLMQIPYMENLRKQFNLFPGTVDSCADILKQEYPESIKHQQIGIIFQVRRISRHRPGRSIWVPVRGQQLPGAVGPEGGVRPGGYQSQQAYYPSFHREYPGEHAHPGRKNERGKK